MFFQSLHNGPVSSSALPTPASVPQCLGIMCPSLPVHSAHCICYVVWLRTEHEGMAGLREKVINDHVMIVFGPCCRVVWPKQILLCRVHPHTLKHHHGTLSSTHSDDTTCSSSPDLSCATSDAPAETPSPEPLNRGKRKRKASDDEEDRDTKTSKCPWS
jgi:hypothetical protein